VVATAIHAGHALRDEIASLIQLSELDRLREEDPFTDRWVGIAGNRIVAHRSRFEVDLNRPRERAMYRTPADAWGLDLWKLAPPDDVVARSLELYDSFYATLGRICDDIIEANGHVVVLDLHSYNHHRAGPAAPVDDPMDNPEINLGTESIHRPGWEAVVEAFADALGAPPFYVAKLDVRFDVRFTGGHMVRWLNDRYGSRCCAIAVEVKKIYMDEWTGKLDEEITATIGGLLESADHAVRGTLSERKATH